MSLPLPNGFRAAGTSAGIKANGKPDMALIVSDHPATAAATFTTNKVCAAPVRLGREQIKQGRGRAIIINSGNANACTGEPGLDDARKMAELTAARLELPLEETFVSSTGSIGIRLPMDNIEAGIDDLVNKLSTDGESAAEGILTSDSRTKVIRHEFDNGASIVAIAKGAGMIEPNMATMLCYVLTDLAIEAPQPALTKAVQQSFNRISVDGDMSTNDTVLLLANGSSGQSVEPALLQEVLDKILLKLAMDIVSDGEGISKVVTLTVSGAASDTDADTVARTVANSLLVKTAWAGTYPVWGRIMDSIGYAKAAITEERIGIFFDGLQKVAKGLDTGLDVGPTTRQDAYSIQIDLGLGDGKAILYTTDCTEAYVRFNMD